MIWQGVSQSTFDSKFGAEFVSTAPTGPGVYRFSNDAGVVIYVGKAKNLRRRLSNYRNATRKRVHRKMRILVREAAKLVYECCESEQAALLLEGELIRKLSPEYNVDGAFAFLYPSIGLGFANRTKLICFTTHPEQFQDLGLEWFGCFRSRPRAKLAFHALIDLLELVGHREKVTRLPKHPRLKGSQLVGMRQLPAELDEGLRPFFAGEHMTLLGRLSLQLLGKAKARQDAAVVQTNLKALSHFFEADAARLRTALQCVGSESRHVAQVERDDLFIRAAVERRTQENTNVLSKIPSAAG